MKPKVLVSVVTYDGHEYCHKEFYDRIKKINYPNYDVIVVDNSWKKAYSEKLKKKYPEFEVLRGKHLSSKRNLGIVAGCDCEEKVLGKFFGLIKRNERYQYLLHLESDIMVPANVIQKLMKHKKDVVSAMYYIDWYGRNNPLDSEPIPVVFKNEFDMKFNEFGEQFWHLKMYKKGTVTKGHGLKKVWGIGAGCFLASRKAVVKIWHYKNKGIMLSIDYWFCLNWDSDDWQEVIPRYVDTDFVVPHVKKDGLIL